MVWKQTCIVMMTLIGMGAMAQQETGKPLIVKRGTIDLDLVEITPVVFKGKLYRRIRPRAVQTEQDRRFVFPLHRRGER